MTVRIEKGLNNLRLVAGALLALVALSAPAFAAEPAFPFGSHLQPYAKGVLKPAGAQAALDDQTAAAYASWKAGYLRAGCEVGQFYVKADTDAGPVVVSEGQGYGMLIVAMMAGRDPNAQRLFDGLYRYYLAHPSVVDPDLMAYAQDAQCKSINGTNSATDGDLDAAYGLLLAHKQWGSAGAIDYLAGARRVMSALLRSNVTAKTDLTNLGDWVTLRKSKYSFASRSSDWMTGHFRAFAKASAEKSEAKAWKTVLKATFRVAGGLQSEFSPKTGLLPDFVVKTDKSPKPAPAKFLEGESDGRYGYNACRAPWRFGIDAAISGDAKAKKVAQKISAWARRSTGGKPAKLRDGYELDGSAVVQYQTMSFVAPFAAAAAVDPDGQKWLDALWAAMVAAPADGYYPDSLKLLSMLAVSQNWLVP